MKPILRAEHWIIQKLKFDRMSNNLIWLTIALLPLVAGLLWWLLQLHEKPRTEFILLRDPAFTAEVAEIVYKKNAFYVTPREERLLLNFQPVIRTTKLQEADTLVLGHTIFQANQLDDWTPHLEIIGYYAPDRELNAGVSVGRSLHPEEQNGWRVNTIIVQDSSVEPVHLKIFPTEKNIYQIQCIGQKGIQIAVPESKAKQRSLNPDKEPTQWQQVPQGDTIAVQAGQVVKAGNSVFELHQLESQEALELKIIQGVRPTYTLGRAARNIIGGLRMVPKQYIPDYLVDEEFIEYVRQAIEQGLFTLNDKGTALRVKGFDAKGQLLKKDFLALSSKQKFLLHKIFNFREQIGAALRWRRPFNPEAQDSYKFYPEYTEYFIIDPKTRQVKNIYRYAAYLTNPHAIAAEVATERGEIYDRDQYSHARLLAYAEPEKTPLAELLLIPLSDPATVLAVNTKKSLEHTIFAAGGYDFSGGTVVSYSAETFRKIFGNQNIPLEPGATFTDGQYTFRYVPPGKGILAQNIKDGKTTRRYYPLGTQLAHIIGYSYAKSQVKGNLERVFDQVLLGAEKRQPWWSWQRSVQRTPGNNVILTLDDDLQRVVYAELQKKLTELDTRYKNPGQFTGAAIVLNTYGDILASASIPSYNPNNIRDVLQALKESSEDHWNSSYINRATHKSQPPGSTMKVIISTIALDNKAEMLVDLGNGQYMIRKDGGYFVCSGWLDSFRGVSFGRYGIPDFRGEAGHGALTLDTALTKSCNNTFAFLALTAGHQRIQAYAKRYGFNSRFDLLPYQTFKGDLALVSNINREVRDPLASLPSEVPDKSADFKITQLARMGIGQWEIRVTPLQMATVAMTVGNLGLRPYPHIVQAIADRTTGKVRTLTYPEPVDVFPEDIMGELFPMMQHVVQIGSGVRMTQSRIPYYTLKEHVAGKTGTAEVETPTGKQNVVWFISFAPVERPQMAIAVVIEKGPIVSGEAVEVARGIWEKTVLFYPELFPKSATEASPELLQE